MEVGKVVPRETVHVHEHLDKRFLCDKQLDSIVQLKHRMNIHLELKHSSKKKSAHIVENVFISDSILKKQKMLRTNQRQQHYILLSN